jgi:copper resistance protein D
MGLLRVLLQKPWLWFSVFLPLALAAQSFQPVLRAQDLSMHEMHSGMAMAMEEHLNPAQQAKLLADKRESEFNHHLAGFFVLLAGLSILAEGSLLAQRPLLRLLWPLCFLLSGSFILIWSDTELWPFGPQSWYYGLTHHPEVLQHKLLAVLVLALGVIEIQRARGKLNASWSGWVFPVLGVAGSTMLLFHDHQVGMAGINHQLIMERIQTQHSGFAITGFGIALSKGLAAANFRWRPFFERLFPALLIVLGALLLVYRE